MSKKPWFSIVFLASALVSITFARNVENAAVTGTVKNASGSVVVGALVTAKDDARGVSFSVVSQDGGKYTITDLPAGKYTVWSLGAGFQSDPFTAEVTDGHKVIADLSQNTPADPKKTASMSAYAALMPEGEAKDFIVGNCTDCHHNGLQEILYSRKSLAGWDATIEKMKNHPYGAGRGVRISDEMKAQVRDYLAANFGTDSPPLDNDKFPKILYKGQASKVRITEFDLPPDGGSHDVAVDANGIAWVGEGGRHAILGRLDPRTLTYTRIPIPGNDPSKPNKGDVDSLQVDSKGHVWSADRRGSRLLEYDPTSNVFNSFPVPQPQIGETGFNTIRFHPDGSVWATEISGNEVIRLDPATKKVTEYIPPFGVKPHMTEHLGFIQDTLPYGMVIAKDGMVWFVEGAGQRIAKIDPQTGKITEYEVPSHSDRMRRMQTDRYGDIWFGEFSTNLLGVMDPETNKILEYPMPTKSSGSYSVDVDKGKNLIWVNEMLADQIASFDPRTKTFVEYPIATHGGSVRRIELDPSRPTRIWYSAVARDTVGFLDVSK